MDSPIKSGNDKEGMSSPLLFVIPAKAGIYEYPLENGTRFPDQALSPRKRGSGNDKKGSQAGE